MLFVFVGVCIIIKSTVNVTCDMMYFTNNTVFLFIMYDMVFHHSTVTWQ